MNALMSSRPRRGSCKEYLSSMSGAAISSMTARLTFLPQNSVNQRPTTALLSASLLIGLPPHHRLREDHRQRSMICAKNYDFGGRAELRFLPWNRKRDRGGDDHDRATRAPPAEIKPAFGVWPTADIGTTARLQNRSVASCPIPANSDILRCGLRWQGSNAFRPIETARFHHAARRNSGHGDGAAASGGAGLSQPFGHAHCQFPAWGLNRCPGAHHPRAPEPG